MDPDRLYRRSELLAAGHSGYEIQRHVDRETLVRLRRGAYLRGPAPRDESANHRLAVHAAFAELGADAVASHGSAAVFHGLPTWSVPLRRVQVTRARGYGGRCGALVHVRVARLDSDEVVEVDGIPVTSLARTVVDLARALPFEPAVAVGDAALATGRIGGDELTEMMCRSARRPGCARARRVVGFLNRGAESVGESRSRVAIARAGLPDPVLQWEVRDELGVLLGRADFGWPERRVIGEFDGLVKYGRLLLPGETAGDAVHREKRREDALRAEGLMVVRWTWPDLRHFQPIAARLRRVLGPLRTPKVLFA